MHSFFEILISLGYMRLTPPLQQCPSVMRRHKGQWDEQNCPGGIFLLHGWGDLSLNDAGESYFIACYVLMMGVL